jgi:hypothetical protein
MSTSITQLRSRERFSEASAFAKEQMRNFEAKLYYHLLAVREGLSSAYQAARKEFMSRPEIWAFELSAYYDTPGGLICSIVTDPSAVRVVIEIEAEDGTILKTGEAVNHEGTNFWAYVDRMTSDYAGGRLRATVMNRAGKLVEKEVSIG